MPVQVFPTRPAVHLALAGTTALVAGALVGHAAIVSWASGIVLALSFARVASLASTRRIRDAGLEMSWNEHGHWKKAAAGTETTLVAEIRNYDTKAVRIEGLTVLASAALEVELDKTSGELPPSGTIEIPLRIRPLRVGRWAVHGLSFRLQGAPQLFEVPLSFSNPFGFEVHPKLLAHPRLAVRGGRSRRIAEVGPPASLAGEGTQFRELRELQPGDPFRRIAWKASARRGHLVVREFDRQERDVVWIIVDTSTDMWVGPMGEAPVDEAIRNASSLVRSHLSKGDLVGLIIVDRDVRSWVAPDRGPLHVTNLAQCLVEAMQVHDFDRSDLTEREVAALVAEHMRPFDNEPTKRGPVDMDALALRAERIRRSAPFSKAKAKGQSARDAAYRTYLLSFGVDVPARAESQRQDNRIALGNVLLGLLEERTPPSVVYVCSPLEAPYAPVLRKGVNRLRRRRSLVCWVPTETTIPATSVANAKATAAISALRWRQQVERFVTVNELRKLAVKIVSVRRVKHTVAPRSNA